MPYESLRTLFYKDATNNRYENAEAQLELRLNADSTFRTGFDTPAGELFLAVPRELSLLNERILRYERRIAAIMRALPPVARRATIRDLVIDEVVSSNELEGVHSTRRQVNDLLQADGHPQDPLREKRFRELARLYLGLTGTDQFRPSTPEDIRAIYDQVMDGEPLEEYDRPDGKLFRKGGVDVIGPGGKSIHEGLFPEDKIVAAMKEMIAIADSEYMPETFSSIVAHYLFEYAHPFYDGNGRTGRYLLALYLSRPLSIMTSLSLSRVIASNRDAYYRSFKEAEHPLNHGELTFFVLNMLENVQIAQTDLDHNLSEKGEWLAGANKGLEWFGRTHGLNAKESLAVEMLTQLDLFAMFPEASQEEIAEYIGLSWQQSRSYTKSLEEQGILEVVSRRPLRFRLTETAAAEIGLRGRP